MEMETVSISEFKATCLELVRKVKRTGQPILITRRGEPMAQIVPPPPQRTRNWLGWAKGEIRILGDIVSPVMSEDDWEAAR
jgi:prevent-host-death family protein